jgi:hypothetical protein
MNMSGWRISASLRTQPGASRRVRRQQDYLTFQKLAPPQLWLWRSHALRVSCDMPSRELGAGPRAPAVALRLCLTRG